MNFLENTDRKKLQKIMIIIISVLTVIALALLMVIIIASVSDGISEGLGDTALKEYNVTDKDLATGSLILADAEHNYNYSFSDSELEKFGSYRDTHLEKDESGKELNKYYMKDTGSMVMTKEAIAAAHNMLVAAESDVKADDLLILYTHGSNDLTNVEYNTAALMCLSNYDENTLADAYREWLDSNAASYGFVESFEDAYRFVGIPHAKYMTDKKLSLADYIAYLKKNTNCDKSLKITVSGTEYAVYYEPCANAGDPIKVPAKGDYTISGTNEGGIIVTYTTK